MKNEIDYGGQVFPSTYPMGASGMTLRDHFAIESMKSLLKIQDRASIQLDKHRSIIQRDISNVAYEIADAMLKARKE